MIQEIAIADIRIPQDRHSRGNLMGLQRSITEIGLLNPITVVKAELFEPGGAQDGYRLVAGRNRLEVFKSLGRETIFANVVELEDLDQRLAEIDENICRQQLTVLEESEQLAERKQIYEGKYPETRHGATPGNQFTGQKRQTENFSFSKDVAEKIGKTDRSIRQSVRRAERIAPDVRDAIRGTEIADSGIELDALAAASPDNQRAIVQLVQSNENLTIRKAKVALKQKKKTTKDERIGKECKALEKLYQKSSVEAQRAFLISIGASIGPPKLKAV